MTRSPEDPPDLQFETAEYPSAVACGVCGDPVSGRHWRTGATHVCDPCHERVEATLALGSGFIGLARAGAFGLATAVVCSVGWVFARDLTGDDLGVVAIGVAWAIAWAVRRGGGGGRAQQALAVGLTYLSVAGSLVPALLPTEPATGTVELVSGWLLAVRAALSFPADSNVLWLVIVAVALWSAHARTARPRVAWTGPFSGPSP